MHECLLQSVHTAHVKASYFSKAKGKKYVE